MIASRPAQEQPREDLFPEVPSHLPVLQYNLPPAAESTGAALPPIPPVQIPTDAACQLSPQEQQRNSSPSASASAASASASASVSAAASASSRPASMPRQPAAAPSSSVQAPPPDYSILYSQPRGPQQPKAEPAPQVIEAYPVLPEEEHLSYLSAVQAQPYRGGPATAATVTTTSTTTSSNTAAAAAAPAPSMVAASTTTTRRSLRDNEETKEYQPGPPISFTQQLRNFMHEVGDVIMEVTDEVAARSPTSGTSNAENGPGQIARRQLMPYRVYANPTGRFDVYVTMFQPQLQGAWSTPQGSRPRELLITTYSSEREAEIAGLAHAPPRWDGPNDRNTCTICNKLFTFMRRPHHCRNCGHIVCSSCSHKQWPSSMVPATYHNNEKKVRTCNGCHFLMETFRDALKHGDYELARQTYESGNVNLHCPNDLDRGEYPVHYAAQGGNLMIMRWLVEEQMCALRDPLVPLLTADKLSVLAVAAMHGQVAIMHYLMHQHGCKITEITDVAILQRALHIIVEAPGDAPPLPRGRASNKKRRGSTRRIASIGNSDFSGGAAAGAAGRA